MNIDTKFNSFFVVLLITVPSFSFANDLSYSYIEAGYISSDTDISGTTIDGNGYGFGASFDLSESLAFSVGYEVMSYDFDLDGNALGFGVEYHTPMSDSGDLIFGFTVIDAEVSHPILGTENDTGNIISFGIRNLVNPNTEINFEFARTDISGETSTGYSFGLGVGNPKELQFRASYGSSDDTDAIVFSIRSSI